MSLEKASKLTAAQLRRVLIEHNVEFPNRAKKALLVRLYTEHIRREDVEPDIDRTIANVKKEVTRQRRRKALVEKSPKKGQKHGRSDDESEEQDQAHEEEHKKVKKPKSKDTKSHDSPSKHRESKGTNIDSKKVFGQMKETLKDSGITDKIKESANLLKTSIAEEVKNLATVEIPGKKSNTNTKKKSEISRRPRRRVYVDKTNDKEERPLTKVMNEIKEDIREELSPVKEEFVENGRGNVGEIYSYFDKGLKLAFQVTLFLIPILFSIWYRDQKFQIGFCGHELPPEKFYSGSDQVNVFSKLDSALERFLPDCTPCPQGAICSTHLQLQCVLGFKKVQNWKNLYGILPFPDYCVQEMKSDDITNTISPFVFALKTLRRKNAEHNCGQALSNDYQSALLEKELYTAVFEKYKDSVGGTVFQKEWSTLVDELKKLPEVSAQTIVTKNGTGNIEKHLLLRSLSKAEVSYFCSMKKFLSEIPIERKTILLSLSIFLASALLEFMVQKLSDYFLKEVHIVDDAVERAIAKLQATKKNEGEKSLDTIQLREYLLCDISNLEKKNRLWQKISTKLAENENIDTKNVELYGDILGIWEWNN
ncbi:hypothetical protein RNJ44_01206 [Nakaseomyces bracarensis]|uniref:LEM-like domain-containing protein n=1 Tax=Nakaseomyces bracarensis TaxID=273131 RepID=A0ABR4NRD4_9SACH